MERRSQTLASFEAIHKKHAIKRGIWVNKDRSRPPLKLLPKS
jgi:hypothetical protein